MSALLHDTLVDLLRLAPSRSVGLLRRALGVAVPAYLADHAARLRAWSAGADTEPDVTIEIAGPGPLRGLLALVEVQLRRDTHAALRWQAIFAAAFAMVQRPVLFAVLAVDADVAAWAERLIDCHGRTWFRGHVIGPERVPLVGDRQLARERPELAVLSGLVHPRVADVVAAARIAAGELPEELAGRCLRCLDDRAGQVTP